MERWTDGTGKEGGVSERREDIKMQEKRVREQRLLLQVELDP